MGDVNQLHVYLCVWSIVSRLRVFQFVPVIRRSCSSLRESESINTNVDSCVEFWTLTLVYIYFQFSGEKRDTTSSPFLSFTLTFPRSLLGASEIMLAVAARIVSSLAVPSSSLSLADLPPSFLPLTLSGSVLTRWEKRSLPPTWAVGSFRDPSVLLIFLGDEMKFMFRSSRHAQVFPLENLVPGRILSTIVSLSSLSWRLSRVAAGSACLRAHLHFFQLWAPSGVTFVSRMSSLRLSSHLFLGRPQGRCPSG